MNGNKRAELNSLSVVYAYQSREAAFHIAVHSMTDAQVKLQHGHPMELLTRITCLKHAKLY